MRRFAEIASVLSLVILLGVGYLTNRAPAGPSVPNSSRNLVAQTDKAPAREPANPKRQAACEALLAKLNTGRSPIFEDWEMHGDVVRVNIDPAFYHATMKQKSTLNSVILCAASEGRNEDRGITLVRYLDARTGKRVALWGESTGFEMTD